MLMNAQRTMAAVVIKQLAPTKQEVIDANANMDTALTILVSHVQVISVLHLAKYGLFSFFFFFFCNVHYLCL